MKMELSIIVPVYNGEKYILNWLNSIYCQVLPKFEVIIVNDGSDEICLDIIKKFVSCHAECILINSVINEGVSKARNHALEIAKGKYIMFLDADDSWKDNKVREIINIATNYDLVLGAFDITYKTKILGTKVESPTLVSKKIYYKKLFKPETQYLYSVLWNKVFRGDIIRKYRIRFRNDIKICEDWTFILDYLDCIDSIYISDCNFYQYSQDNFNSLVKKKRIRRENVNGRTQVPLQICGCFHSLIIYHRISLVFGCVPAGFLTMAEVLPENHYCYHSYVSAVLSADTQSNHTALIDLPLLFQQCCK